ncbi:MAG TPA: D-alanine--D-alanine ligase [Thermomicrobiaceae bacterium]|nr:D-alanine--D-alanine ligase [Thermomicrobiaceae bacterium]
MQRRLRVGVIFGGRSGEHDVSLRSAQAVMHALEDGGFTVVPIGVTRAGQWLRGGDPLGQLAAQSQLPLAVSANVAANGHRAVVPARQQPLTLESAQEALAGEIDVLFPVLHGPYGEDGTVQGFLELADIPYVGSGVLASSVGMDKVVSRQLFAQAGLPQARWLWFLRRDWRRDPEAVAARIERELGFPCFTKPANLGSSVGIAKVHHAGELAEALDAAAHWDRKIIVEEGLDARELEVSVLGNDDPVCSVAGEIVPANEFYDYDAKYVDEDSQLLIPAPIPVDVADELRALAVRAFKTLDGAGLARVDFFLERSSGRLYLNELNTIPGFTATSMYPRLWEASGLAFPELVTRLVELAVERYGEHGQA